MNRLLFLLLFSFTYVIAQKPTQFPDCRIAVSTMQFQQLKRNVLAQNNPAARYQAASQLVQKNCLNTSQVLELLGYLSEDNDRLGLAMDAYPRLVNKEDVYDIYNAFAYFSTAFRFHDYVFGINNQPVEPVQVQVQAVPKPAPLQIAFAPLIYPDPYSYQGKRYCTAPISEADFMVYAREIAAQPNEPSKLDNAGRLIQNACLSAAQCMKIATLLSIENDRLTFLKLAYPKVYDEGNFDQAVQVFGHQPNQQALMAFVSNYRATVGQPVPPPCQLTDAIFSQMKTSFARENSSSSRLSIVKDQLPRYSCYTSAQIKQIVALFNASSDKLDLGKFAFDYVIDKENYFYEVSSLLPSSMDRTSLSNYIASRR